jgi:hypothetical protein
LNQVVAIIGIFIAHRAAVDRFCFASADEAGIRQGGQEARKLRPGDVVSIAAGLKNWHGAASDSWFSNLAIEVPGKNNQTKWLEPLSDSEYDKLK